MERISVLLADDYPVVRQGLRALLELLDDGGLGFSLAS